MNFLSKIIDNVPFALIWDIITEIVPVKELTGRIFDWLQSEATKTTTKLDDEALKVIRDILTKAGYLDDPIATTK